jgi:tetratricopeptide (TPR) repeat protein
MTDIKLDAFSQRLKDALEHLHDPDWLGSNSPLAAPYFLAHRLAGQDGAGQPHVRGVVLRRVLLESVCALSEPPCPAEQLQSLNMERLRKLDHAERRAELRRKDGPSEEQRALYWQYFDPARPTTAAIQEYLNVSHSTYYRLRPRAEQLLVKRLVDRVTPALRLEAPLLPDEPVGRAAPLLACLQTLQQARSVALTGPSGIGKTTLAAALIARLAPRAACWFTLRPGLNDHLGSLLFALSAFLERQGAGSAWRQLVADQGKVNVDIAQSLIRHDLASLPAPGPLLCFDDLDLLQPTDVEAHAQIRAFVESLRREASLLLIGQHLAIEADEQLLLPPLSAEDMQELLLRADVTLAAADRARLSEHTAGNPRLLQLFVTLHHAGEPLAATLQRLAGAPSIEALVRRLWPRLEPGEQDLLAVLAAFRRPAPQDGAGWDPRAIDSLIARRLVQRDGQGGIAVLPALRGMLYQQLAREEQEAAHAQAAAIRAAGGEYTAAAYHYLEASQPQTAVWLWDAYRAQEINQGQGEAALALFGTVSSAGLNEQDRETLALVRSELYKLVGDYPRASAELRAADWRSPLRRIRARQLEGDIADLANQFEQAVRAYRDGLETVASLPGSAAAHFHRSLGRIAMRQRDLDQAWNETQMAHYEVKKTQGQIQANRGNYAAARACYLEALALTQELGHAQGEAKIRSGLATVLALLGEHDLAQEHWEQASQMLRRVGDLAGLAGTRVNQAFGYVQAGQYQAAIPPATEALAAFERLGEPAGCAVAAMNLAEAHLALGAIDDAEHWAKRAFAEGESRLAPDALRVLGEVKLAQGALHEAAAFVRDSLQRAEQQQDRLLMAYAWRALGKVLRAQQQPRDAAAALERAIDLFEQLELLQEVAATRQLGV